MDGVSGPSVQVVNIKMENIVVMEHEKEPEVGVVVRKFPCLIFFSFQELSYTQKVMEPNNVLDWQKVKVVSLDHVVCCKEHTLSNEIVFFVFRGGL